jgi:hypothetical protein
MIFNQLNVEEVGGRRRLAELDELLRNKSKFQPVNFLTYRQPFQEYDNYFRTMSTNAV